MAVSIIGSGNVATVLSRLFKKAGYEIAEIISRNEVTGSQLAEAVGCNYSANIHSISKQTTLVVICLSDESLKNISGKVNYGHTLTVHTAGSVSMEILKNVSVNYGVLYPLQSLRKEMKDIPHIPFLLNANNLEALTFLEDISRKLSGNYRVVEDEQRLKLHLAAVISSNFSNHLFALADDFCRKEGVEFSLLLPLLNEIVARLSEYPPKDMQTGPAVRGDQSTIAAHLALLDKYPALKNLYQQFTESIRSFHQS